MYVGCYNALTSMTPNEVTRYGHAHVTPVKEDLATEARGSPARCHVSRPV